MLFQTQRPSLMYYAMFIVPTMVQKSIKKVNVSSVAQSEYC